MTYLVDVTVRAAADPLDQLEVVLRVPAGDVRRAAHLQTRDSDPERPGLSRTSTHSTDAVNASSTWRLSERGACALPRTNTGWEGEDAFKAVGKLNNQGK